MNVDVPDFAQAYRTAPITLRQPPQQSTHAEQRLLALITGHTAGRVRTTREVAA